MCSIIHPTPSPQNPMQGYTLHLVVMSLLVFVLVTYCCIRITLKLYLKIMKIYCLIVSVGQESTCSLGVSALRSFTRLQSRYQAGFQSHLKAWLGKGFKIQGLPRSLIWSFIACSCSWVLGLRVSVFHWLLAEGPYGPLHRVTCVVSSWLMAVGFSEQLRE